MHIGLPRKTLAESGILRGSTDYHSHILPGVDDGFQTMAQSLKALRVFEELSVRELWLTPHVMEDYPNKTESLRRLFVELSEAYAENAGRSPIRLRLAAEYMLDSLFVQLLEDKDLLPYVDDGHLLVETSYYNPPMGFDDLLSQIVESGYTPVLAHPERYHYMSMKDYRELRERGIVFQLDTFSLLGAYGREAAVKSHSLLKRGFYALCGSDVHELDHYTELVDVLVRRSVLRRLRELMEK